MPITKVDAIHTLYVEYQRLTELLGETTIEFGRVSRTEWARPGCRNVVQAYPEDLVKWRELGYVIVERTSAGPWTEVTP